MLYRPRKSVGRHEEIGQEDSSVPGQSCVATDHRIESNLSIVVGPSDVNYLTLGLSLAKTEPEPMHDSGSIRH
jgi:hypothetical protein